ncbi:efflux RND transporter periplasmic adaptor subunit [Dyella sp. KRB-257]|uniref:efflux RND transporter periplasmic adaptor subunit n=1 Tax=Dyella sp. KRB-257 TaxID=3400915 RepID=UPI003BFDCB85
MNRKNGCAFVLLALLLVGCADKAPDTTVLETVHAAPLEFSVHGEGELRAAKSTALLVPGPMWTPRQITWMLPDGSQVAKGDLVARFSAEQSKQDLAQARIDLERNLLARRGKQAELEDSHGKLGVDLTQVAGQLAIAQRYANAGPEAMARNDILDAVQDAHYLGVRQGILQWREQQSSKRGSAELAVLDAQHATFDTVARQKKDDLDALELRAPHDGVLVLEKSWSGEVAHTGGSLYAGSPFGSLPDLAALEVQLAVPQIETQGIRVGDTVELHPWGEPSQRVTAKLSWVAAAAQSRSRQNPVKYLMMKATVPADVAHRYGWTPGQHFVGKIVLLKLDHGLSVPNVALGSGDGGPSVQVLVDGKPQRRAVTLGVRGPTRAQVLGGLAEGDRVLLGDAVAEPTAPPVPTAASAGKVAP